MSSYAARIREAVAAVEQNDGNVARAARELGVSRSTLRDRLARRNSLKDESTESERRQEAEHALKRRVAELEKQQEALLEQLEKARKPRSTIPITKPKRRDCTVRFICADVHGNHQDAAAVGAMLGDAEALRPDECFVLGDLIECGGWLAEHHTLGYVAQIDEYCYEEDVQGANSFLDALQNRVPHVEIVEGNHDQRVERWCVAKTMGHPRDAEFMRRRFAPEIVLALEKRGIPFHRMSKLHDGLHHPGIIRRGRCHFTHGYSSAKHAAWAHLAKAGGNIVYGHTHRADYATNSLVASGMGAAWCPGCLCRLQPTWKHTDPTDWTHGYLVQIEDKSTGLFQMIPVPIIEGRSMLGAAVLDSIPV